VLSTVKSMRGGELRGTRQKDQTCGMSVEEVKHVTIHLKESMSRKTTRYAILPKLDLLPECQQTVGVNIEENGQLTIFIGFIYTATACLA
jgi:hypothetical protein